MRLAPLLLAAACSAPSSKPVTPPVGGSGSAQPVAPADAPSASDEEKLAAIQKAMNELDEAMQGCWAAAATERFDIEGDVKAQIDIGSPAGTAATVIEDTTRNKRITDCVAAVLQGYAWAPPLYGQSIQLPFRFRAPAGQNVIDRKLVAWNGQGNKAVSLAVLIDDANTGNDAASMIEVALAAGGSLGMRTATRTELWYFLGPATVAAVGKQGQQQVAAGDMAYVPKGGARDVIASGSDVHAVLVLLPGGKEGAARAGALPTPPVDAVRSAPVGATILRASAAKTFGPATIYAEPAVTSDKTFSAAILQLKAGAAVPEHVHAGETELLYVLAGAGTMTIAGTQIAVTPTSVVQIPPNTKHAFIASADVKALQIYTPAGPEQRFKNPPKP